MTPSGKNVLDYPFRKQQCMGRSCPSLPSRPQQRLPSQELMPLTREGFCFNNLLR